MIDAAVATNAVLGVTQPNYCGFGGDLFCLYYEAETRRVHFLNGAGRSGARATLDELGRRGLAAVPIGGPRLRCRCPASRARGPCSSSASARGRSPSCSRPPSTTPPTAFRISDVVCQAIRERFELFDDPEWRRIFVPGGVFPEPGDMLPPARSRPLAQRARRASRISSTRDGWAGPSPTRLEREGFLTADDLAAHEGEWGEPVSTTYRGYTVYETPPPTQGLATAPHAEPARRLRRDDARDPTPSSDSTCFSRRPSSPTPTVTAGSPIPRTPVRRSSSCSPSRMRRAGARRSIPSKAQYHAWGEIDGDTTGFVVADGRGNVLSRHPEPVTGLSAPAWWRRAPAWCSRTAALVLQHRSRAPELLRAAQAALPHPDRLHGDPRRAAGAGPRPAWAVTGRRCSTPQILTNALDYGMEIQEAIERPRFMYGRIQPTDPADLVRLEGRVPSATREALARRGHNIAPVSDWFSAGGAGPGRGRPEGRRASRRRRSARRRRGCGILEPCDSLAS